ncbi:MAG: hypothetical protein AB1641_09980 [Thermodesulfobacteriota bacterium]
MAGLAACAYAPPTDVALDYWKRRTRLDLGCAAYVEKRYRIEAAGELIENNRIMTQLHPNLAKYRFDFTRIKAGLVKEEGERATVAILGKVAVYDPDTTFFDETSVTDLLDMKWEDQAWRIDYTWNLDGRAQRTLRNLASAQRLYFNRHQGYTDDLKRLAIWFLPDPTIEITITWADRKRFSALARHKDSPHLFAYDSSGGGVLPYVPEK